MNKEEKLLSCKLWWLVDKMINHQNYQEIIIGIKIKNLEARKKKVLLRKS